MNLTSHPSSLVVTGAELLELGAMQKRGELRISGMEVGQSVLDAVDKLGRKRMRHVPSGYTVNLSWPAARQEAMPWE